MNKTSIYHSINKAYYKNSPREKQIIFRRCMKNLVIGLAIAIVSIAILALLFWSAFIKPNPRDSYENSKNIEWQQKVAEYKETGH